MKFQKARHFEWTDLVFDHQANITSYSLAFPDRHLKADRTADPARKQPGVAGARAK